MGHRRFLHGEHPFRFDEQKFGSTQLRQAPTPLSGEEILECTKDIVTVYGKDSSRKNQDARNARKGSYQSFSRGDLFGSNFHIGKI
jgi:hypothetical protein